jgi:hypothetical protein
MLPVVVSACFHQAVFELLAMDKFLFAPGVRQNLVEPAALQMWNPPVAPSRNTKLLISRKLSDLLNKTCVRPLHKYKEQFWAALKCHSEKTPAARYVEKVNFS